MATVSIHSLQTDEQALLCAMMLFGREESDGLYRYLEPKLAQKIKTCANAILELDRPKRIKLLVTRIKALLQYQQKSSLSVIEVSWIVKALEKEPSLAIKAILEALPPSYSKMLLSRLPQARQQEIGQIFFDSDVKKESYNYFLRAFENQFAPMPYEELGKVFSLHHILLLRPKDLLMLTRELGLYFLADFFKQVGLKKAAELLRHYSKDIQESILHALKAIALSDSLANLKNLKFDSGLIESQVFSHYFGAEDLYQRFGLYVLNLVCSDSQQHLLTPLAQRLPYSHGKILLGFERGENSFSQRLNLENFVIKKIIDLSARGKIDSRYAQTQSVD